MIKRIVQTVIPPPRVPVTWRSTIPLLVFLVVFVGACAFVEFADLVVLSRLWPFAFLLLTPWVWWMHAAGYSGLPRGRATVALLTRLILLGLLIFLLAEPRAVRRHDALTVVFVVDISASVSHEDADWAMQFVVNAAADKPERDEAGLLFFGRDAAVELPPAVTLNYESVNVHVNRDGTNIAEALSLGAAMLPETNQGRLVLISDGVQTEGNLRATLDDLRAKDIAVDVVHLDYEHLDEVWMERLELPRFVKLGETYEAAVIVSALGDGQGQLILQENGQVIYNEPVTYQKGKNRYVVPIYLRQPGYYEYAAHIEAPHDRDNWSLNNHAISYLYLRGKGRVLLVTDPEGDPRDWSLLRDTLVTAERAVDVVTAYESPIDPLALLPYDCIILPNTPRDAFSQPQLEAMRQAVHNQGAGLVMIGGQNSFGPGGYARTPIEEALPVSTDISQKKVLPKGALAIILHTCEFPQGNTWGKRITKQAIKVLNPQDDVGVLAYDYSKGASWVFPLTPASDYERLAQLVNGAQIGDMPDFATTMKSALMGLQASDAATKHVIIISDGDPSPPPPSLLQQFIASQISITTVAIFPHGGTDISSMRGIANATGGRYYHPQDPNKLPSIFIKEAKTLRRTAIQNKTFTPQRLFPSEILKGIDATPPLHGYVMTTIKPRANLILAAPEEEQQLDPVLATWRYGTGAAAAFTSDLSPNWGADWVQWQRYEAFVKQLVQEVSRVSQESNLRIHTFPDGNEGVVLVEDFAPQATFLAVAAQINGPDNTEQTLHLEQTGPRRYEARFPLTGQGRYQLQAIGVGEGREERAHGGFVVPFSQEYLRFRSDPITLDRIVEKTQGRMLTGNETGDFIYHPPRQSRQSSRPIADLLLILLACLIPLDVGLRRVQMDWELVKGWFGVRERAPSDETFTQLLARKKEVGQTMAPGPSDEVMQQIRRARAEASAGPSGPSPDAEPDTQQEDAATTTSRLLEAKRRASKDQDKND